VLAADHIVTHIHILKKQKIINANNVDIAYHDIEPLIIVTKENSFTATALTVILLIIGELELY